MSIAAQHAAKLRRYAAECLGTALLVLVGVGSAMVAASSQAFATTGIALAFGGVVTVLVAAIGPVSGAHFNPAVTLAFWSQKRFPVREVIPYVVAQCVGATLASVMLLWVFGPMELVGVTLPTIGVTRTLFLEAGYSAFLAFVIFMLASDKNVPPSITPIAIGTTIFLGALITGPLTGGSFNPARSLGPALVSGHWAHHWIYWVAPISGMWIGAVTHKLFSSESATVHSV